MAGLLPSKDNKWLYLDGPGVAFRVGNIIAQVNVVPNPEAGTIDQQSAELVLAQNISRRLANADFTPCEP